MLTSDWSNFSGKGGFKSKQRRPNRVRRHRTEFVRESRPHVSEQFERELLLKRQQEIFDSLTAGQ